MKVDFDDQIFLMQPRGGISRYFVELMRAYRSDAMFGVELDHRPLWTRNHHLLDAGMGRRLPTSLGQRRRVMSAANRMHRTEGRPAVVHHTYFDRRYLKRAPAGSVRAVTIYDMIPELYPEVFPDGNPHMDKQAYVEAADLVFCISEATKGELVRLYGQPAAPIVVTPLGVDDMFRPDAPSPAGLPGRFVLFVGKRDGYKDFAVLAEAFAGCDFPPDIELVAVGGGAFGAEEKSLLGDLGLTGRTHRVEFTDAELAGAYAHALCFVFPSRHEGFGLPTLEAMASGCPTILVSSSSHPEVGGDAALYFPPGDVHELARHLADLEASPERRDELCVAGPKRAKTFSWRDTACRTAAAYHDARTA